MSKNARSDLPRLIVILLAVVSLGTTILITLNVLVRYSRDDVIGVDDFRGGMVHPAEESRPSEMGSLPDFTLVSQDGVPISGEDLRGKVWVVDFIFTRCSGPCPMMTSRMAQLQMDLSRRGDWGEIRLVSISVDPQHDTPSVLRQYARLAHADTSQWLFLTGRRTQVWDLIKHGFRLPVYDNPDDASMPIAHSQKFVLIDRQGRIRGYYDATPEDTRHQLLNDLDHVMKEGAPMTSWASPNAMTAGN